MSEQRALDALRVLGLEQIVTRHGPVDSLAEAAEARGIQPGDIVKTLVVRRGRDDYLFVLVPGLPADNNLAERSIRPVVIMRKISGGTRSEVGSATQLGLASLFATWQARGLNPFQACLQLLQHTSPP